MGVQEIPRMGYKVLRALGSSDDTNLVLTSTPASQTGNAIPSGAVHVPTRCVSMQIIIVGTDAEDEVANWWLYGYKPEDFTGGVKSPTPAEYLAHGTATLGQQVFDPASGPVYYADTIAITAEGGVYDVLVTTAGANSCGSIAKLICNNPGFEYIYMIMQKSTCASMGSYLTWH